MYIFGSFVQVLMDMFSPEEDVSLPLVEEPIGLRTEAQSYEDIVKDFIFEETQYMRDLSQIIKVFRAPFVKHFPTSKVGQNSFFHAGESPNGLMAIMFCKKVISKVINTLSIESNNYKCVQVHILSKLNVL